MTLRIMKEAAKTIPVIRKTLSKNLFQKERLNEEMRINSYIYFGW